MPVNFSMFDLDITKNFLYADSDAPLEFAHDEEETALTDYAFNELSYLPDSRAAVFVIRRTQPGLAYVKRSVFNQPVYEALVSDPGLPQFKDIADKAELSKYAILLETGDSEYRIIAN